jgi:hypothetical protein
MKFSFRFSFLATKSRPYIQTCFSDFMRFATKLNLTTYNGKDTNSSSFFLTTGKFKKLRFNKKVLEKNPTF